MVQPATKKSEAAAILLAGKTRIQPMFFCMFFLNNEPGFKRLTCSFAAVSPNINQKLKFVEYTNSCHKNHFTRKISYQIRQALQDLDF